MAKRTGRGETNPMRFICTASSKVAFMWCSILFYSCKSKMNVSFIHNIRRVSYYKFPVFKLIVTVHGTAYKTTCVTDYTLYIILSL